jgi:hypothetical protein
MPPFPPSRVEKNEKKSCPFSPSRMNKRKVEKNHAFFPFQKLEKITIFLQRSKVTKKKKS